VHYIFKRTVSGTFEVQRLLHSVYAVVATLSAFCEAWVVRGLREGPRFAKSRSPVATQTKSIHPPLNKPDPIAAIVGEVLFS